MIRHIWPQIIPVWTKNWQSDMPADRRTFLAGVSTALVGTVGFGTAVAAEDSQLQFAEINPEKETLIITNTGDTEFDLSGYVMEFEYKQNVSQSRPFPEGTTISAGGSLTVASGAKDDTSADVTFDYDDYEVINNEGDKVAVLTPDESEAVITHTIGEPLPDAPEDSSSDESSSEEDSSPDTAEPSEGDSDSSEKMADDSQSDSSDGSPTDESDKDTESESSSGEDSNSDSASDESPTDTDDSPESSADDSESSDSSSPVEEDGC